MRVLEWMPFNSVACFAVFSGVEDRFSDGKLKVLDRMLRNMTSEKTQAGYLVDEIYQTFVI